MPLIVINALTYAISLQQKWKYHYSIELFFCYIFKPFFLNFTEEISCKQLVSKKMLVLWFLWLYLFKLRFYIHLLFKYWNNNTHKWSQSAITSSSSTLRQQHTEKERIRKIRRIRRISKERRTQSKVSNTTEYQLLFIKREKIEMLLMILTINDRYLEQESRK